MFVECHAHRPLTFSNKYLGWLGSFTESWGSSSESRHRYEVPGGVPGQYRLRFIALDPKEVQMLESLRSGMVLRMTEDLKAGTLPPYERAVFAALTMFDMEVQQAITYAGIFGGSNV